ncbi:MAG: hypothetical protein MI922_01690, partial [Bacteroidales bacterium]|nr:hypothetical protein [Bacteroidales bacterium]
DVGVVVAAVTANDEECIMNTFGNAQKYACYKRLTVVWLLEDDYLLAKTRPLRTAVRKACMKEEEAFCKLLGAGNLRSGLLV